MELDICFAVLLKYLKNCFIFFLFFGVSVGDVKYMFKLIFCHGQYEVDDFNENGIS